ncbi:hypothetical protein C3L33_19419, partial [Rhododendron williamsianum]
HAFHIGCIDEWLEKHSGCPLCRVKIDAEDLGTITYADSTRFLSSQQAEVIDDPGGELFIQREDSTRSVSSRFNFRNSLRKSGRGAMKADESPVQENDNAVDKRNNSTHKLNHKIIVPDVVLKKSWSYLSSSDHVKLNSEMLGDVSRKRFSCIDVDTLENSTRRATEEGGISEIKEETGRKTVFEPKVGKLNRNNSFPSSRDANYTNRSGVSNANDKRSMSESTGFSRFKRNGSARESPVAQNGGKKDRFKRLWLPIAQRTVQWYADIDKKSQQSNNAQNYGPGQSSNFQPSLAVVIGIMSLMFSLTFILIVYAKFCHKPANAHNDREAVQSPQIPNGFVRQNSLHHGIDKTVIESIPFFRFSSLKGSRRGLECVVCLSKFEDVEILRLLPKCKHAFHIGCIDEWLEKHSTCPLCRVKISADDLATITDTDSMRLLSSQAEVMNQVIDDPGVQLYVQREDSSRSWSSRFRNSLRRSGSRVMKPEELPIQENDGAVDKEDSSMHKFNHKIIMSDVVMKKRWSYLSSSDLEKLNSEMLGDVSRKRFSCLDTNVLENSTAWATEEGESDRRSWRRRGGKRVSNLRRSMSEITVFSRFKRNGSARESPVAQNGGKEERLRRLWLPIAERTVRWYGDRDKKSQQSNNMRESLNV